MNTDYERLVKVVQQLDEIFLTDIENDSAVMKDEFNIITKPWGYKITFDGTTIWNSQDNSSSSMVDDNGYYIVSKVLEQCKEEFVNNVLNVYEKIINNYKNHSKDYIIDDVHPDLIKGSSKE